jgi:hypothetical protein
MNKLTSNWNKASAPQFAKRATRPVCPGGAGNTVLPPTHCTPAAAERARVPNVRKCVERKRLAEELRLLPHRPARRSHARDAKGHGCQHGNEAGVGSVAWLLPRCWRSQASGCGLGADQQPVERAAYYIFFVTLGILNSVEPGTQLFRTRAACAAFASLR